MTVRRPLLRLESWLIRAVIPPARIGTYLLYRQGVPVYAGRSDHDLQRRLLNHAAWRRAEFFEYDCYSDIRQAYDVECALFHALRGRLTNSIHPAAPVDSRHPCLICGFPAIREARARMAARGSVEASRNITEIRTPGMSEANELHSTSTIGRVGSPDRLS